MTIYTKNHAELTRRVEQHIAADAVVGGEYWVEADNDVGGEGCFIGCLVHGSDAKVLEHTYGLPLPLVRIAENIFESLTHADRVSFFRAVPDAIATDGKDLSRAHWAFLACELRALPLVEPEVQVAIGDVIEGMDLLAKGEEWPNAVAARDAASGAARAAANVAASAAAYVAANVAASAAANVAANVAASAAANAARAAASAAARLRQRDTLLRLIEEAPVAPHLAQVENIQ